MLKLKQKELNKNRINNKIFNNQNKFDELKLQFDEKPIFKLNTPELTGNIIDKEQITATKAVIFAELENYS
jgi:chromosome condensin MukBEF MukE localization factor